MNRVRFASQVQILPDQPTSMPRNNNRPFFIRPRRRCGTFFRDSFSLGWPIAIQAPCGHREHAGWSRGREREAAQMSFHHDREGDPTWPRQPPGYAHGHPQEPREYNVPDQWHQQGQRHQGSVNFQGYHPHLRCRHGRSFWYGYVQ
jgi:hypothetical protein